MNLSGDEKRIRQLFREMSAEDQARAPQFATVIAAASSRIARSQCRTALSKAAAAVAILCVAILIAMAIILRYSKTQDTPASVYQAEGPTAPPEGPSNVLPHGLTAESSRIATGAASRKRSRHRRNSASWTIAMNSLFAWQSPTASLMQTRGDELMRSLPRLGESLQKIRSFSPDEFN